MAQYILKISSYDGLVPGATHYRGRVEGPEPESCHGGHMFSNLGHTCSQGHPLPGKVSWEVEAVWTEERFNRYIAGGQEGDSASQFGSAKEVMDCAILRFLDGCDDWWSQPVEPAQEGDELWYGWVNPGGGQWDDLTDPSDGWGCMIASCHRG